MSELGERILKGAREALEHARICEFPACTCYQVAGERTCEKSGARITTITRPTEGEK
jgi:hypothetical protein